MPVTDLSNLPESLTDAADFDKLWNYWQSEALASDVPALLAYAEAAFRTAAGLLKDHENRIDRLEEELRDARAELRNAENEIATLSANSES